MLQDITSDGWWAENGWCLFSENERSRCHRCEIRLFSLRRIAWNFSHNGTLAWFSLVSIFQWHSLGERRGSNYFTTDYIKFIISVESGQSSVPYSVLTWELLPTLQWDLSGSSLVLRPNGPPAQRGSGDIWLIPWASLKRETFSRK